MTLRLSRSSSWTRRKEGTEGSAEAASARAERMTVVENMMSDWEREDLNERLDLGRDANDSFGRRELELLKEVAVSVHYASTVAAAHAGQA